MLTILFDIHGVVHREVVTESFQNSTLTSRKPQTWTVGTKCTERVFLMFFFLDPQSEIKIVWAHWIRSQTYWVTSACGDKTTSRVWLEINSHAGRLPWRGEIEITCGRHLFCGHNFIITPQSQLHRCKGLAKTSTLYDRFLKGWHLIILF